MYPLPLLTRTCVGSADELAALKRKHEEETQELVQRYNKQYSDMLKQRLDEEVRSTSSYSLSKAVALTQARRSFVLCVHASDQDKLRAQLEEENRDACRSLSIQFENRLKKFRDEADAVHNQTPAAQLHTHSCSSPRSRWEFMA